jgi:hypothetical protein
MRGGSLRWQAQTLRKLRVPALEGISDSILERLVDVSCSENQEEIDDAAGEAYGLLVGAT